MRYQKRRFRPIQRDVGLILTGSVLLAGVIWWARHHTTNAKPAPVTQAGTTSVVVTSQILLAKDSARDWLPEAQRRLRNGARAGDGKALVQALLAQLAALPASQRASIMEEFLATGLDAPTGLGFRPAKNGRLEESPTLRVFLLDYLARTDPTAAAAQAKDILREAHSPDEWAVALRNLAQVDQDAEGKTFLDGKMNELLRNQAWQADPSEGYLEAFDVAVHLGGTNLVAPLAELLRKPDNKAVSHAAFLALDRLTITDTAEVLRLLLADPNLLAGRELTRANYFARAMVGDPRQREAIELYLLDPRLSPVELGRFASLFPNASYMLSQNLLTLTEVPDSGALARRDRVALGVVEGWLRDTRFERLHPQLESIRSRLEEFVRGTDRPR